MRRAWFWMLGLFILGTLTAPGNVAAGEDATDPAIQIDYELRERGSQELDVDLLTRNQGPTSIHEVQIQSQNFPSISLQHSEIGVGETVTDSIQIPFDPNEEPEPLVWEVTYTDASGNRSETILQ